MDMITVNYDQMADDYQRVEQAILFLEANQQRQPGLKEVADNVGLSEYHFQRLFTRWVGISPKRFLQYLTKEHAKALLEGSGDLLRAAYESGLSGPGRLHDLFISCEAVTPGEYKRQGDGIEISYGVHPTPFGECLLALTPRGICNLVFVKGGDRFAALAEIRRTWQRAALRETPRQTRPVAEQVVQALLGDHSSPLSLHLRGTNFQIKVWEALLQIPEGRLVSYEDIAAYIGQPRATQAVGSAIGLNPIPLLIPCHRVIRKSGEIGGYHYGSARKKSILGWEMARTGV